MDFNPRSAIEEFYPHLPLLGGITAAITDIALVNEIDGPAGRLFVWSYKVAFENLTASPLVILSRSWRITTADGREKIVFHGTNAAPLSPGDERELEVPPGENGWAYWAGIASFSSVLLLEGGYRARLGEQEGLVGITPISFTVTFNYTPQPVSLNAAYLTEADSRSLADAIDGYAAQAREQRAVFRCDRLKGISKEGVQLISAALIYDGNLHDDKLRRFDLSAIASLPRRFGSVFRLASTDNFIIPMRNKFSAASNFAPKGFSNGAYLVFYGTSSDYESILSSGFFDLYCESETRKIKNNHLDRMSKTQQTDELCRRFLTLLGVPAELQPEVTKEIYRTARPRWQDRHKYPDLAELESPLFLKKVHADDIHNGALDNAVVLKHDPDLILKVQGYLSNRKRRPSSVGDGLAEGLSLQPVRPAPIVPKSARAPRR